MATKLRNVTSGILHVSCRNLRVTLPPGEVVEVADCFTRCAEAGTIELVDDKPKLAKKAKHDGDESTQ